MEKRTNYLDKIPIHSAHIAFRTDGNGIVTLLIENAGIYNKIAQKLFKKPQTSYIRLDETGSFVWLMVDGQKSVYEIAVCVEEKFGDKALPLYERLIGFLNSLSNSELIKWIKQ